MSEVSLRRLSRVLKDLLRLRTGTGRRGNDKEMVVARRRCYEAHTCIDGQQRVKKSAPDNSSNEAMACLTEDPRGKILDKTDDRECNRSGRRNGG